MKEDLTLRNIDGEINVVTLTETLAPISTEELDRQIAETQERLNELVKMRKSIADFKKSNIEELTIEKDVS